MSTQFQNGDLIGFSGQGFVADGINLGSYGIPRWDICHIGIVCEHEGVPYLWESSIVNNDGPCEITNATNSGVQARHIGGTIQRPGKVWHYKLRTPLSSTETTVLQLKLLQLLGRPYDLRGAIRSGGFLLRILGMLMHREDVSTLFCSEMVAHLLDEIKVFDTRNASGWSPNALVRNLFSDGVVLTRERL